MGRIRGRLAVDVCPIPPTDTAALCLPLLQKPNAGEQQRYNPQLGPKALEIAIRHSSTHQIFHFCYLSGLAISFFFFVHVIHTTQKEILKYMARHNFFFLIPSISSCLLALSGLPINICFPILQKFEINSGSGKSFTFQTKRKIN